MFQFVSDFGVSSSCTKYEQKRTKRLMFMRSWFLFLSWMKMLTSTTHSCDWMKRWCGKREMEANVCCKCYWSWTTWLCLCDQNFPACLTKTPKCRQKSITCLDENICGQNSTICLVKTCYVARTSPPVCWKHHLKTHTHTRVFSAIQYQSPIAI